MALRKLAHVSGECCITQGPKCQRKGIANATAALLVLRDQLIQKNGVDGRGSPRKLIRSSGQRCANIPETVTSGLDSQASCCSHVVFFVHFGHQRLLHQRRNALDTVGGNQGRLNGCVYSSSDDSFK